MQRPQHWAGTLLILLACATAVAAQIRHIEPMNWWVGMKNPMLQLLVHADNIGSATPVIRYKGVTIRKTHRADSPNYLFIDLHIAPGTRPGTFPIAFQKNGKTILSQDYTLLPRQKNAADIKGFATSDVICLITPDRFVNGDPGNDVVAGTRESKIDRNYEYGRHGGDIRGIINSVDYLSDLGYTAIWSTPLLENDMASSSYHGYAITDFYRVDPRFGTLDDYKELSDKMRQKGMKLIFDGVVNHTGSEHWWMSDRPFKNWINFPDSIQISNHRRTINQDLYAAQYDKKLQTEGWFVPTMPDMNGKNPFLATYLTQNSIWWIETLHLGGIRQDTYCYSDKEFLEKWSCGIMSEYPNFNIVGEEWSFNPLITSYWQRGKKAHDGNRSCLKSVMDFPMQSALTQALKENEADYGKGLTRLYESLANDFAYADPQNILIFGDNHDMDRIFTQLNGDAGLTQMALSYLLTIRGIPQLYYGTEVLMDNAKAPNNHGVIRSDFPGGWAGDAVNAFTGQGLNDQQRSTQEFMRKMLRWRKTATPVHQGKTLHFAPFDGIYTYFRYTPQKTVMVMLNNNTNPINVDTRRFTEIISTKTIGKEVLTGETFTLKNGLKIAGKSALVLELE
jgi:neopullulanase